MFVVGFNGPPYSGKDTAADMLARLIQDRHPQCPVFLESLSIPLREIAYKMVGRDYDPITYDDFKREKFPQFEDRSGRQLMIDVSESFLKPTYGQSVMAQMLIGRMPRMNGVLLISSLGFQCEVDPLCDYYGGDRVAIVHMVRDGHSFVGDSREWVYDQAGCFYQLWNQSSLENLHANVEKLYSHLTLNLGWQF